MPRNKRGIVLVTVMVLVVLLAMLTRASIVLGPASLALSESSSEEEAARYAAEAGLSYARSRLLERPTWRGDDNQVTVSQPDFTVVEDHGNVIGLLTTPGGSVSQFRLRFNYQDGAAGADSLDDPASINRIDHGFISLNNLQGSSEIVLPRAQAGSWRVLDPTVGPCKVPGRSVCIVVEGRAGHALRNHTAASPNAPIGGGRLATRVIEAGFQTVASQPVSDSPIMGGGDVNFNLAATGLAYLEVDSENSTPRLRSKKGVNVLSGTNPGLLRMRKGEVGRDPSAGFQALAPPGQITLVDETVGDGKDFYNLKWGDIETADDDPNTNRAVQIPGGTYVYWPDGSLHYYDKSLSDYETYMNDPANAADPGVSLSSNLREVRTGINLSQNSTGLSVGPYGWNISRDLRVLPSAGGVGQLNIIPRAGFQLSQADTSHVIAGSAPQTNQSSYQISLSDNLTSPDDIVLAGQLNTKGGTLVSEGNLTVNTSVMEETYQTRKGGWATRRVSQQVSMYAKKNVTVSSYQAAKGGIFDDVLLQGVVYSWGDFLVQAGDSSTSTWGEFKLNGCMVAYGADPSSGAPGSSGSGKIDVTASRAALNFDSRGVPGLAKANVFPLRLSRTLYAVH